MGAGGHAQVRNKYLASKPRARRVASGAAGVGGNERTGGPGGRVPAPHSHTGDFARFTSPNKASGFQGSLGCLPRLLGKVESHTVLDGTLIGHGQSPARCLNLVSSRPTGGHQAALRLPDRGELLPGGPIFC